MAGAFVDDEALLGQAASHSAGDGEGGQSRAGRRSGGDQPHHLRRPHAGIERGREAVQEPGVGRARPLRQGPGRVAYGQVEHRIEVRQVDPVKARRRRRPGVDQGLGRIRQFGPVGQGAARLLRRQRKPLDRKDVQPPADRARPSPQVQQGRDVQSGAEAQFRDGEASPPGPDLRQAATVQEHRPRLGQPVVAREIDIAKPARARLPLVGPGQAGRGVVGVHGLGFSIVGAATKKAASIGSGPLCGWRFEDQWPDGAGTGSGAGCVVGAAPSTGGVAAGAAAASF